MTNPKPLALVLAWSGDETLYSWSARMHLFLLSPCKETGKALFGAVHSYKEWAVNANLFHLNSVTHGRLGSSKSILLSRTPLASFYPFLSEAQQVDFDQRANARESTPWLVRFGMRASRLDGGDMRWCPHCVDADLSTNRLPRWRLPHQMSGAWWCLDHHVPLKKMHPGRAEWTLPTDGGNHPDAKVDLIEHEVALRRLAGLSVSLIGKERVNTHGLRRALLGHLRHLGVLPAMKPMSPDDLCLWFVQTTTAKAVVCAEPKFDWLLTKPWIHEVLHSRRASHPLLWLILWASVFEDMSDHELIQGFHDPERMLLWQEDGQGQLWVEASFQSDDRVQSIVRQATSVEDAAKQLNVSVTTVRRYMRQAQCVHQAVRAEDKREQRKQAAVEEIERLINSTSDITKSDVHYHCKSAVSWLRRWDPDLLVSLLSRITEVRARQMELVYW
jgi:transposase-like protein